MAELPTLKSKAKIALANFTRKENGLKATLDMLEAGTILPSTNLSTDLQNTLQELNDALKVAEYLYACILNLTGLAESDKIAAEDKDTRHPEKV